MLFGYFLSFCGEVLAITTMAPSINQTFMPILPSSQPTCQPSRRPTLPPTNQPSGRPTSQPSCQPSNIPTMQPSGRPTCQPTLQPSGFPTTHPTKQPSIFPTTQPSAEPTRQPTGQPTALPSSQPTSVPSIKPSGQPSRQPTEKPSSQPSSEPSSIPSDPPCVQPSVTPSGQPNSFPSNQPSSQPTLIPSAQPICRPSTKPSGQPSKQPFCNPSSQPSVSPTAQPSIAPSSIPSKQPTDQPTYQPLVSPSAQPSVEPTGKPSDQPSAMPSSCPSAQPSTFPSSSPTSLPTVGPSMQPSSSPTVQPSMQPSRDPTAFPTCLPTGEPSSHPSFIPSSDPSSQPSSLPSNHPSSQPSRIPSAQPSSSPTSTPTVIPSSSPSNSPSEQPTIFPSAQPSVQPSYQPSSFPSSQPTCRPSATPTMQPVAEPTTFPSSIPSNPPSQQPSCQPTFRPSAVPSCSPSSAPSNIPTSQPSLHPSSFPSVLPSGSPSAHPSTIPSSNPSTVPSQQPSNQPTSFPSAEPTIQPTAFPSLSPTMQPSSQPSHYPTVAPSGSPTLTPTTLPSGVPTSPPTIFPSTQPSTQPSSSPSNQPSSPPTGLPSGLPTMIPSQQPSNFPTSQPSRRPTSGPSGCPSSLPSTHPSVIPSINPTAQPLAMPSSHPSAGPSSQPTGYPTVLPSGRPSSQPTLQPSTLPTQQPTMQPSVHPTKAPSAQPISIPTLQPTVQPSFSPSFQPTMQPSVQPSSQPSIGPSSHPTSRPSSQPSSLPSVFPTTPPSAYPTDIPSSNPTIIPTAPPSMLPSVSPSSQPTVIPTNNPSSQPSTTPSHSPSTQPSSSPTTSPSKTPSNQPSRQPSSQPSMSPTTTPSSTPTKKPSMQPSGSPTRQPSHSPSMQPSRQPTNQPTTQPSKHPLSHPSSQPTSQPSHRPTKQPTAQPFSDPTTRPTNFPSSWPTSLPTVFVFPNIYIANITLHKQSIMLSIMFPINGILYAISVTPSTSSGGNQVTTEDVIEKGQIISWSSSPVTGNEEDTVMKQLEFSNLQASTSYLIYFAAILDRGEITPTSWMLANRFNISTACCRSVSIIQSTALLVSGVDYESIITVRIEGMPVAPMKIMLALNRTAEFETTLITSALMPSSLDILGGLNSATTSYTISLSRLEVGNYSLTAKIMGSGSKEYEVIYVSTKSAGSYASSLPFIVQSQDKPLPPPQLSDATFANDGTFVVINFSTGTNQGGISSAKFTCDLLFSFNCASQSTCFWISSSSIYAYIDRRDECLMPGNILMLSPLARLQAACPTNKCNSMSSWPIADVNQKLIVGTPDSALIPTIVLTLPDSLASCGSLILDVQSSIGSGGRSWRNATATVSIADIDKAMTEQSRLELSNIILELVKYLDDFRLEPPTIIPSSFLLPGTTYLFTITLCNFLNKCGRAIKKVEIKSTIVPSLTITGAKNRFVTRNLVLSLFSSANIPTCDGETIINRETLSYNWTVYSGIGSGSGSAVLNSLTLIPTLRSTSNNPARFLLPSYSLSSNSFYTIVCTVTTSLSKQQASSFIQVTVGQGAIVAVFIGSKMKSVRKGGSITIDASASYDEDVADGGGDLLYSWICLQTQPILSSSCDGVLNNFVDSSISAVPKLSLIAKEDIDASFTGGNEVAEIETQITVTVYDQEKSRSSSASLTLTILPSLSPVITLSSNLYRTKMNPAESLKLAASVNVPSGLASNMSWTLDDTTAGIVDLQATSLTPISQVYQPIGSNSASMRILFYLALPANSLPSGITYSFTLICSLASPGRSASSVISIEVNKAPSPGLFLISPSFGGEELSTSFVFSCSRWIDADLPLTFVFGYLSSSGQQVMLRSRSEASFSSNQLPAGQRRLLSPSDGYLNILTGISQVYDSYLASSYIEAQVEVKEKTTQLSTIDILSFVQNSSLSSATLASSSVDEIKQATALVMYLLNKVDCTQAPNCTALNRKSCSRTANTCGECISSKYLGDKGDANNMCYSPLNFLDSNGDSRSLVNETKSCAGNCSGHGSCISTSIKTGKPVANCKLNQIDCQVGCQCEGDYYGDTCGLSIIELEMKRKAREDVVNSLVRLTEIQDSSTDSTESIISTMVECSQKYEELSTTSMESLLTVSLVTLQSELNSISSSSTGGSTTSSSSTSSSAATNKDSILSVINNVGLATALSRSSSISSKGKRLLAGSSKSQLDKTSGLIETVLQSYGASVGKSLVPSQEDVVSVQDTFRLAISSAPSDTTVVETENESMGYSMTLPRSSIEEFLEISVPKLVLPIAVSTPSSDDDAIESSDSSFYYAVHQLSTSLQSWNDTEYAGAFDSISVMMPQSPCEGETCRVEMVFPRSLDDTTYGMVLNATVISVDCPIGETGSVPITCPSVENDAKSYPPEVLLIKCNGTESKIEITCPQLIPVSKCEAALASVIGYDGNTDCKLISEDDLSITCSCMLPQLYDQRRRLLNSTTDTTISVSYVAMISTTLSSVSATIVSAENLNASVLTTGWQVIITLGTLIGFFLVALFATKKLDNQEENAQEIIKTRNQHAKAVHPAAGPSDESKTNPSSANWKIVLSSIKRRLSSSVSVTKRKQQISPKPQMKQAGLNSSGGLMSIAEEALPKILGSSKSLSTKVQEEMKRHHRWLGVMFFYCKRFPRMLRVTSLATNIIIMLFVQSITYNLSHGDDGSCELYNSETNCLATKSAYQTGASKCYWNDEDNSCNYVQPDNDAKVVIFIAILSAVISTPFAVLTDWMIQNVLASPTLRITNQTVASAIAGNASEPERNLVPVVITNPTPVVISKPRPAFVANSATMSLDRTKKMGSGSFAGLATASIIQAGIEFQTLVEKLQCYRQEYLKDNEQLRHEFDGKFLHSKSNYDIDIFHSQVYGVWILMDPFLHVIPLKRIVQKLDPLQMSHPMVIQITVNHGI